MQFAAKKLNQYETVGEVLTAARQEKQLELERVEKILKINKRYLAALEAGEYSKLPGDIYTRNFLRSYAELLQVNPEHILELLDRELQIAKQVEDIPHHLEPAATTQPTFLVTPQRIRNIGIGVLTVALLVYFGWQIYAIFAPPPLTVSQPEQDVVTSQQTLIVSGQTEPAVTVTINNEETVTDPQGGFSRQVELQNGLNTIEVTAQKRRSRPNTVTRQVIFEPPANPEPPEEATELLIDDIIIE